MLFLARFILKGHSQAALVAATTALLGVLFTPALWVSGGAIVLVTLVKGPRQGIISMLLAIAGAALFSWLVFAAPQMAMMFVLMAWLPAWLIAAVLQQSVSLAYSLQVLTGIALAGVAVLYALWPDMGEAWREPLEQMATQLASQSDEFSLDDLNHTVDWLLAFMPALLASSVMFGAMISLFLGRWWQAVLYNPGGFGREFRSLNLGKTAALIALAIMLLAMVTGSVLVLGLVTVVLMTYSIQALSLIHAVVNIRQISGAWLFFAYALLFFIPHLLILVILLAFADPWLDIRGRLAAPGGNGPE
ncbi:MAG TPA: hypothetical protein ENJ11_08945 [Gammaproteobacteria bacterium]|nr:hypothetical protein [Gammaproteobacteria bacterium]